MAQINKYLPIAFVVLAAFFLQAALIFSDCQDTPARAAVNFTKAYYQVDPAMSGFLCKKYASSGEGGGAEAYIRKINKEAHDRGYRLDYLKSIVYHVETYTHMIDDKTAEVKLHASRRTAINPVFALIGKFFLVGETFKIDETIPLVRENGKWKVCGSLFDLSLAPTSERS